MSKVSLPNLWRPRDYQQPLFNHVFTPEGGLVDGARACMVWHRRCGKDSASLQLLAIASQIRVGTFWHMAPTLQQVRRIIWDGIDKEGRRMIDQAFPKEMRKATNNSEMKIEFKNGSIWQCVGSDNYDSLVGTNPVGVVFSEYSIADPRAWDFIRPILAENGGFAVFIYTPRGKNHGHKLFEMAKGNPKWYAELLTIDDTQREDGTSVITQEAYLEEINAGMDPQLAQQEYYCSFDAGLFGAYYTDQLKRAKLGNFPHNPRKPVHTSWDLGLRDATSIWFFQETEIGGPINVIYYLEANNVSLIDWCKRVSELPYSYGTHIAPHDIERRDYTTGETYLSVARDHGIDFEVAPKVGVKEGIDSVKAFLPRLQFDVNDTGDGYDCLSNYRREYNDKLRVFMDRPLHDWASHGADAMRYAALSFSDGFGTMQAASFRIIPSHGRPRQIQTNTRHSTGALRGNRT